MPAARIGGGVRSSQRARLHRPRKHAERGFVLSSGLATPSAVLNGVLDTFGEDFREERAGRLRSRGCIRRHGPRLASEDHWGGFHLLAAVSPPVPLGSPQVPHARARCVALLERRA